MKVLVLGSSGLVGSAIKEQSKNSRHTFIFATRKDADLTKEDEVDQLFNRYRPMCVINCSAICGGIGGNLSNPVSFYRENILMNSHVMKLSHRYGVDKLLMFSSVCVFDPKFEVIKEDLMLEGHPFEANASYGWAKRMIDVEISAYKKQYKVKNWISIIPGNIYGCQDNYNLQNGHVLPALIHKIYLAKKENKPLTVWGDGSSRREFIYSKDLANSILKLIELPELPQRIIISGDRQISIRELVDSLCKSTNFNGQVIWNANNLSGQKQRSSDLFLLKTLIGDIEYTDFNQSIKEAYQWFESNYPNVKI